MILAVDFDGVISLAGWPNVGEPNMPLVNYLKYCKTKKDTKLILWTCRGGEKLDEAVEFCKSLGLEFDAVNENLQSTIDFMHSDTRKIYANYYIDDRNMVMYDNHLYFMEKKPNEMLKNMDMVNELRFEDTGNNIPNSKEPYEFRTCVNPPPNNNWLTNAIIKLHKGE